MKIINVFLGMMMIMSSFTFALEGQHQHEESEEGDLERGEIAEIIYTPPRPDIHSDHTLRCMPDRDLIRNQGTPGCFTTLWNNNIPAWTWRNSCPVLNPEFTQCISDMKGNEWNRGKDFISAIKFWSSWKLRPIINDRTFENFREFQ